eukprot:2661195-Pyramimonas_sp.AAC.1
MMTVLRFLELQTSYRVLRHSNRKEIITSASLKYLDARSRSATATGSEKLFVLCKFLGDRDGFLG